MSPIICRPCCRTLLSVCQPQASTSYLPAFRSYATGPKGIPVTKSKPSDNSDSTLSEASAPADKTSTDTMVGILAGIPVGGQAQREPEASASGTPSMVNFRVRDVAPEKARAFSANKLYQPHFLSQSSLLPTSQKYRVRPLLGPSAKDSLRSDPFHLLSINPIDEALNASLVRGFISQMGKIKGREETGLTWKNQRRMGKMVRRSRAMGIVSRWTNMDENGQRRD